MKTSLQKLSKRLSIAVVAFFMLLNSALAQTINIATATDLAKIGIDTAYPLDGDYKQTADIDLSGFSNWTPINTFTGTYDGQYHYIDHLKITGSDKSYQGLFSELGKAGQVKNLYLKNVNINLDDYSSNVGALAGHSLGQISRVAILSGSVRAYYIVGGLVGGQLLPDEQLTPVTISESYANVTVQDNGYIYVPPFPDPIYSRSGSQFGGLLGINQNGAQVSNSYATGNVTGTEDVGGLVGYNTANGSIISKSYASSVVTAPNGEGGGFIGLNGGNASDCYWNITTSGQTNGSWSTPNIAAGKTNAEMKQQATFVGWDFNNVWEIENGVSQPTLKWMSLAPLPVSLLSFKAHAQTESIKLTWQTASESINKEFIIYRSGDQKEFELLTRIAGSGNSTSLKNYNYYDEHPLAGNNYYKLAQVDEDGKETELGISTAYFGFSEIADLQIFPNPVEDEVKVLFGTKKYTAFSITDLNGKILQNVRLKKDENGLSTSMKNYAPGIYLFQFNGEKGSVTKKVLKK